MKTVISTTLLMLLCHIPLAWAVPPQTEREIDQLLDYIGSSDCEFERNGSTVTPARARSHIELKYGNTRRYIDNSEDFIKYAATRSSLTGRAYQVRCNGVEQPTAAWLQTALERIRGGQSPATDTP